MTDDELNIAIAAHLGFTVAEMCGSRFLRFNGNHVKTPDYCNDWNTLMPLVKKYKIDFEWSEAGLTVDCFGVEVTTFNEEFEIIKIEQRAIVECLLKVLESKL